MPSRAIHLCALLLATLAAAACFSGTEEAKQLRDACEAGDDRACHAFAVKLQKGEFILQDRPRAAAIFDTSCSEGVGESCGSLGNMVLEGQGGTKRDTARAVDLFRQGCNRGGMNACGRLGVAYRTGTVVPRDPPQAVALFRQACDGGDKASCALLGEMLAEGEGSARDLDRAVGLFRSACDTTVSLGCVGLGRLHLAGEGVVRSDSLAAELFTQACGKTGHQDGCFYLAELLETGRGTPQNFQRAATLYRRECEKRNGAACVKAAKLYESLYRDSTYAAKLRKEGCAYGAVEACTKPKGGA
jgi:uncharacterized protein